MHKVDNYLHLKIKVDTVGRHIRLTSVTRVKCGIPSTLCWKIANISRSTELFGL